MFFFLGMVVLPLVVNLKTMANKKIKPELASQLRTALLKFDKSPYAKNYLFKGYSKVTDKNMQDADKYTKDLK